MHSRRSHPIRPASPPADRRASDMGASKTPTVLVDYRDGSKKLIAYPPLDQAGEICTLSSGDVCISGNGPDGPVLIGIEVKGLSDLLTSLANGRLQGEQVFKMVKEYGEVWLLYYGQYRPCPKTGTLQVMSKKGKMQDYRIGTRLVPYGYLESFLVTLMHAGVNIKHVSDLREAANWIGCFARWWNKEWSEHKGMKKFNSSRVIGKVPGLGDEEEGVLDIAQFALKLPGLGYERAIAAAQHFGSIHEMVNASVAEWRKIPGVGAVIAEAIYEKVRRRK